MRDDTPIYHELLDEMWRQHRLATALIEAVFADHYADHDGPIMFCGARGCRAAWGAA